MISHKYKFIFVHVPKTGGISILKALGGMAKRHMPLSHYAKNNNDYFKFTFVRNPWCRLVSCYHYFKKYGRKIGHDKSTGIIVNKYINFKEFCQNIDDVIANVKAPHFRQMYSWIDSTIDFIGKTENLQEDFNTICDKIGIPQQELPHINKTKHKHYTEYYDDETRQIVAEKYAKDIEYFGYEFGE